MLREFPLTLFVMDSDIPLSLSESYGNSPWRILTGNDSFLDSSGPVVSCAMLTSTTDTVVSVGSTLFVPSIWYSRTFFGCCRQPIEGTGV